eukprot:8374891-Lingulodinium_polyedra.AAC.1
MCWIVIRRHLEPSHAPGVRSISLSRADGDDCVCRCCHRLRGWGKHNEATQATVGKGKRGRG